MKNFKLESSAVQTTDPVAISDWRDVGVTIVTTGAVGATGTVQGSRGGGHITDVWEDLAAYGDAPLEIDNSIRRIRLNTTAITSGEVVVEVAGND